MKLAEQSGHKLNVLSREPILNGLRNLHALFSDAPTLGSLIDPNQLAADLTYSYVQDWISIQAAGAKSGQTGADLRLAAAQALSDKLKLILTGEPPYDIFVRWKPLAAQASGWHPDLNDGVRMNIRPFVQAGILRKNPNIKWTKDRGKEPQRPKDEFPWFWNGDDPVGDRVNDVHLTNAEKQAARKKQEPD